MKFLDRPATNRSIIYTLIGLTIGVVLGLLFTQTCLAYKGGMSISTMGTTTYISSDKGDTWLETNHNANYYTVFEYDAKYTFFKHTAEDMTSMYLIADGTLNLDTATMHMNYRCQSDVGNVYYCDIWLIGTDTQRNMIVNRWSDDEAMYMVAWYIKSFWINEEEE